MDDRKIELLETTFAEVRASQDAAAALFYERLFVNDPSLRRLFNTSDMAAQGRKLMAARSALALSLMEYSRMARDRALKRPRRSSFPTNALKPGIRIRLHRLRPFRAE